MTNILEFKRPDPPSDDDTPLAYVTIFKHATHFDDPNRDEPDQRAMGDAIFDSTFYVHKDLDDCQLLVMIGKERTDSMRGPGAFETPAQRQWLARRLDEVYEQVTGATRSRNPVAAFCMRLFTRQGDDK